ncbi:MAG: hypothetical protein ACRC46_15445 [Thermoguttaceae bacterium]
MISLAYASRSDSGHSLTLRVLIQGHSLTLPALIQGTRLRFPL